MKKTRRKLTLTRETLVNLERPDLFFAVGGLTNQNTNYPCSAPYPCVTLTCQPPCEFSNGRNTCLTCAGTCTTNLC